MAKAEKEYKEIEENYNPELEEKIRQEKIKEKMLHLFKLSLA